MGREEFTFRVGDYVEDVYGNVGYIKDICTCEKCAERGFYEPIVQFKDGTDYITQTIYLNIECYYNRIGNYDFTKISETKNLEVLENDDVLTSISNEELAHVNYIYLECTKDNGEPAIMKIDTGNVEDVFIESIKDGNEKSLTIHIEGDFSYVITD